MTEGFEPAPGNADEKADEEYDAFFARMLPRTVRVARRLTGDLWTAEEVAVEALARAHARWARVGLCDLPEADVAMALGVSTGTVKTHLHRSRRCRPTSASTSRRATRMSSTPDPHERLYEPTPPDELLARSKRRSLAIRRIAYSAVAVRWRSSLPSCWVAFSSLAAAPPRPTARDRSSS